MNFEHTFQRQLNVGGSTLPALGSDVTLITGNVAAPPVPTTNSCYGQFKSMSAASGQSPTKLLVSVIGPAAANAMSANVYVWNERSGNWVQWAANIACANGGLTSIAMPAPAMQRGGVQSLEDAIAFANVATANGTYTFDVQPGF